MAQKRVPSRGARPWWTAPNWRPPLSAGGGATGQTAAQPSRGSTCMPSLGKRSSPPLATSLRKTITTLTPKRWQYCPCASSCPSGVIPGSHLLTFSGSRCSTGSPATRAIRASMTRTTSGDSGGRSSPGPAKPSSAAHSSRVRKPGTTEIFGSWHTVKARSTAASTSAPSSLRTSSWASTVRQRSDASGLATLSSPSWSPKSLSTSSHCFSGLSLKKQLTPNFIPTFGGRPACTVLGSSTLGRSTLDHMTAQPLRGTILMFSSGKYVSPPSPSATSFK
mmetsp:Transcript_85065/g.236777  ORF Transcript_85065/g.236777 Transcript_85065/m.236777 type:complete len:278 (+) Transcript_85065:192-1025(+)